MLEILRSAFAKIIIEKEEELNVIDLNQLHQYNLWQNEMNSNAELPPSIQHRCHVAFLSRKPPQPLFKDDVTSTLRCIGLNTEEDVQLQSGYRLMSL